MLKGGVCSLWLFWAIWFSETKPSCSVFWSRLLADVHIWLLSSRSPLRLHLPPCHHQIPHFSSDLSVSDHLPQVSPWDALLFPTLMAPQSLSLISGPLQIPKMWLSPLQQLYIWFSSCLSTCSASSVSLPPRLEQHSSERPSGLGPQTPRVPLPSPEMTLSRHFI